MTPNEECEECWASCCEECRLPINSSERSECDESPQLPEPEAPPAGQSIQSTNMLDLFRQMRPRK